MAKIETKKKALSLKDKGLSTSEIAEILNVSVRSVQRWIHDLKKANIKVVEEVKRPFIFRKSKYIKEVKNVKTSDKKTIFHDLDGALWLLPEDKKPQKRVVGVFSDTHLPYSKLEYLDWLIKIFKKRGVTDIVCLGDLTDSNTISNYMKNPEGLGTLEEFNKAYDMIQEYAKVFPVVKYCNSNHDSRCAKIAASAGIPKLFLKPFADLFNLPKTWDIKNEHIIDDVLYIHGERFCNRNAITNIHQTTGKSTVAGHCHSNFGVFYTYTGYNTYFNMFTGCLIDRESFAFEYGKNSKYYPVLGAGVVYNSKHAEVIPYEEDNS